MERTDDQDRILHQQRQSLVKMRIMTIIYSSRISGKLHVAGSNIDIAMVESRRQLNVRIPGELYEKIEIDGRQKQEVVTAALELYFGSHNNIDVARDLEHEKEKVQLLENNLHTLEQQLGFLQLEFQKMSDRLMLPLPAAKPWWQFWK